MAFRLSPGVEQWFSHLDGKAPFRTKFDLYYLCLMLGLASGRRADPAGPDFIDYFVDTYKSSQRLIAGLLTVAELKKLGIDMEDKAAVRKVIAELFDPAAPTGLSDEGIKSLNRYASGGFAHLTEAVEKPHHAEAFLPEYHQLLQSAIDGSDVWKAKAKDAKGNK